VLLERREVPESVFRYLLTLAIDIPEMVELTLYVTYTTLIRSRTSLVDWYHRRALLTIGSARNRVSVPCDFTTRYGDTGITLGVSPHAGNDRRC